MSQQQRVTYRFNLRDRSGLLLGLQAQQCIVLGAGVFGAGALLNAGAPGLSVFVPLVLAVGFSLGQWQGRPIHTLAPIAITWGLAQLLRRNRRRMVPRFRQDGAPTNSQPSLAPFLRGTTIDESDVAWTRRGRNDAAAVIRDDTEGTATAVLRVSGREFALCEREDQERLLAQWGGALAAFCAERTPVTKLRWTEWAAPAGLDDQLSYLAQHQTASDDAHPVAAYWELLDAAAPMSTRHEVLLALTVAQRKLRRRRGEHGEANIDDTLLDEVRLLSARLETAGLAVSLPLSPTEVATVVRSRLDPYSIPGNARRQRSLSELAGLVSAPHVGLMRMENAWDHVRMGRSFHAAYAVAEWPRVEVAPNWMEPLLLHAGGIRTIAVHYEPVAHSRSHRQVGRDAVKLASEEEQRHRSGFRVGARHRRAQAEVAEREAELVAGYPEFEYVGTAHVCAADRIALERSCAEYEQLAAQVGIELRRLDGQHDLALTCLLPIGRGITPKRGLL